MPEADMLMFIYDRNVRVARGDSRAPPRGFIAQGTGAYIFREQGNS